MQNSSVQNVKGTSFRTVLFVGHSSGYTGAPLVLLRLCKWIKANSDIEVKIILKADGPLRKSYERVAPVHIYHKSLLQLFFKSSSTCRSIDKILPNASKNNWITKSLHYGRKLRVKRSYPAGSVDLIFSNTLTNGEILESLSYLHCPIICRVAELKNWIQRAGKTNFTLIEKHVSQFIAVSEAVKRNLVQNHQVSSEKIVVIPGFVDDSLQDIQKSPSKKKLGIPDNAIVIGGSGGNNWIKGKDLFIQLAITILNKCSGTPFFFIWIGGENTGVGYRQLVHDIHHAGLENKIKLIPNVTNPLDYFALVDIFALVSREDSYPTTILEVAMQGKPSVCFENAGGAPEFVEDDAGIIVPYLDINAMAEKITALSVDELLRKKYGERAKQKAIQNHSVSVGAGRVLKVIEELLKEKSV